MHVLEPANRLMQAFALRTGLNGEADSRRYLWTDAFAVCNFVGLAAAGVDPDGLATARRLVDRVHAELGRYRADDARTGPIGRRDEAAFARHPTAGGLRIGKPLPERGAGQPADPRLEWERDGQYFHYLTRWMHALQRLSETTADAECHRQACELAEAAHRAFVVRDRRGAPRGMVWKMSTDLDRVLVDSMGLHDPVDGWITAVELAGSPYADDEQRRLLGEQVRTYRTLCAQRHWATPDPLGIGGLLTDAWRLWRAAPGADDATLNRLLEAAAVGLGRARAEGLLGDAPAHRLAFRELGLAIGLEAAERMADARAGRDDGAIADSLEAVLAHRDLARAIASTWRTPANRTGRGWREHRDINEVMLATSLAPDGWLGPAPAASA
jgi:hypothetical protein